LGVDIEMFISALTSQPVELRAEGAGMGSLIKSIMGVKSKNNKFRSKDGKGQATEGGVLSCAPCYAPCAAPSSADETTRPNTTQWGGAHFTLRAGHPETLVPRRAAAECVFSPGANRGSTQPEESTTAPEEVRAN
jgi:hypothetical protein